MICRVTQDLITGIDSGFSTGGDRASLRLHQYPPDTAITRAAAWQPQETSIVVCDMCDTHTCPNAALRVELADLQVDLRHVQVALVEAGGPARQREIHIPAAFPKLYKTY